MDKAGKPSRWNTLRALRVLKHFDIASDWFNRIDNSALKRFTLSNFDCELVRMQISCQDNHSK